MPPWLKQLLPILILLAAIAVVVQRLPKVDLGHSEAFQRRRRWNWLPLGLTYAFLYMARYNLSANVPVLQNLNLLSKEEFGSIDGIGSVAYGVAFLINGPLTDRWGGRATILIAAAGSALMNVLMGVTMRVGGAGGMEHESFIGAMTFLNAANMYFQSFGAVSIVKVNAPWFHVRERGVLGGVFGILISLGLYFAYDWTRFIGKALPIQWAFHIPAAILVGFFVIDYFLIRDTPGQAGFKDFDTADASSGDDGPPLGVVTVARRMFSQPVIWIIVAIEFCSGFLRNAIMKWYLVFADKTGEKLAFVATNWGVLLCVAGILGGVFAGFISDHVFDSRRGPVATVLYAGMVVGAFIVTFTLGTPPRRLDRRLHVPLRHRRPRHALRHGQHGLRRQEERRRRHRHHRRLRLPRHRRPGLPLRPHPPLRRRRQGPPELVPVAPRHAPPRHPRPPPRHPRLERPPPARRRRSLSLHEATRPPAHASRGGSSPSCPSCSRPFFLPR
ncbi:Glycerol-3-phosphate transporter [Chondromyces apiculatus DSM 436]|uniref:Glycerol-3-phosphate transporter n=1 Tax=Chondromyces apiculatus DSM 436 TaxID=1192034 RepID=A0A017TEH4_9BACT|nr:MFS transporter [Chondromyces apiculatus]EYF07225.1 Glycerol-3-phosphate transporter [Chondromyces apiculatus DSM 436]